ncbi:hypothetical protein TVAGG3_0874130 [Trichomonas vaginalis G3]|uniref:hypothetical protein n=1 Tax=Trichomonas vaginalis (strain ATCC PRA-98 / G3) TaxID=412133 RepID=UPI0021E56021|nr:hypothetical protein TVAGG3_0874130 [Trichomonas vaginalis G3]KAI5501571.1 hypothetical protein TVAGG3_0874130 [Trichomonas vaginalis G3]
MPSFQPQPLQMQNNINKLSPTTSTNPKFTKIPTKNRRCSHNTQFHYLCPIRISNTIQILKKLQLLSSISISISATNANFQLCPATFNGRPVLYAECLPPILFPDDGTGSISTIYSTVAAVRPNCLSEFSDLHRPMIFFSTEPSGVPLIQQNPYQPQQFQPQPQPQPQMTTHKLHVVGFESVIPQNTKTEIQNQLQSQKRRNQNHYHLLKRNGIYARSKSSSDSDSDGDISYCQPRQRMVQERDEINTETQL